MKKYNKNVTRLTKQGCNNIVISRLYRTCLIVSTRLLQVVNSLFQTCWQLGTSSANTTCWWLDGRLATHSLTLNSLQIANTRVRESGEHFSQLHFISFSKTGKRYSWNSLNSNWKNDITITQPLKISDRQKRSYIGF
jgi:hypothetical protein